MTRGKLDNPNNHRQPRPGITAIARRTSKVPPNAQKPLKEKIM